MSDCLRLGSWRGVHFDLTVMWPHRRPFKDCVITVVHLSKTKHFRSLYPLISMFLCTPFSTLDHFNVPYALPFPLYHFFFPVFMSLYVWSPFLLLIIPFFLLTMVKELKELSYRFVIKRIYLSTISFLQCSLACMNIPVTSSVGVASHAVISHEIPWLSTLSSMSNAW